MEDVEAGKGGSARIGAEEAGSGGGSGAGGGSASGPIDTRSIFEVMTGATDEITLRLANPLRALLKHLTPVGGASGLSDNSRGRGARRRLWRPRH